MTMKRVLRLGILVAGIGWAQPVPAPLPPGALQPDAQRTRQELADLFNRYPPNVHTVLALDPGLLSNPSYLAPYPALGGFLSGHPEIARNPSFYLGDPEGSAQAENRRNPTAEVARAWESVLTDAEVATCFILAMSLIAWLIRTFMDSRRWSRWTKVQTEAHARVLDRLASNEDLLAYINSSAGSKFLQSSPIMSEAGPRSVTAPLGRILWTVQGGIVLVALGIGFEIVSRQSSELVQEPMHAFGILAMALGIGFIVSAIISFGMSWRLGLLEHPKRLLEQGNG
jgi:hypothetical protein